MSISTIPSMAANPVTWALYFIAIAGFMLASLKFRFSRETWKDFFRFMMGLGGLLAGLGYGFQALSKNLSGAFHFSYTIESIITLIFIIIYIILLMKLGFSLFNKAGWEWLGAIFTLYGIGAVLNAILTGGHYLPFVGWLYGS